MTHPESDTHPELPHVGRYERVLPVSLERMFENVLDWAHLPWVHASTFAGIRCEDYGAWGWRAEVVDPAGSKWTVELKLDRARRRWITRNLDGAYAGAQIWSQLSEVDDAAPSLRVAVDFYVPGIAAEQRARAGDAYSRLYQRLYDEDVDMMVQRQRQLELRIDSLGAASLCLGSRAELVLPVKATLAGREFVVADVDGQLRGYPARCPHLLGPLDAALPQNGQLTCPWHGFRFDLNTGECASAVGLRLHPLAVAEEDGDGQLWLRIEP